MAIDRVLPAGTTPFGHRTSVIRHSVATVVATTVVATFLVMASPAPAAHADVTLDQQLLTLMNQDRAANGLGPLESYAPMASLAENGNYGGCGYSVAGRAADMGARNYFSHTILNCGSRSVFDMLTSAGIPWTSAAENIGWESGSVDPAAAARILEDGFMNSPGHRANILDPATTHVGVGSWRTAAGQTWSGGGAPYSNVYVTAVVFAHLSGVASPAQPPSAVGGVAAGSGSGRVSVSWQSAAATAPVDVYGVWAYSATGYSGRSAAVCGTCTTATVDGLVDGTAYVLVVAAHNAAGWGGAGFSPWVTSGGMPSAPGWVSASPGQGQVQFWWAASNRGLAAVDAYLALVYDGPNYSGRYAVTCGTCTGATVTGLTAGHSYTVYVLAHNAYGWGPAAAAAGVRVS